MVISFTAWEKSSAWSMAMLRVAWVSQVIIPPQARTSMSQMAPVRRSQIGVSAKRFMVNAVAVNRSQACGDCSNGSGVTVFNVFVLRWRFSRQPG